METSIKKAKQSCGLSITMEQQVFEGTLAEILQSSPELVGQRVRLTVLPGHDSSSERKPAQTLAEALEGKVGRVSFQPSDLSERTGEAFAELLKMKHDAVGQSDDAR